MIVNSTFKIISFLSISRMMKETGVARKNTLLSASEPVANFLKHHGDTGPKSLVSPSPDQTDIVIMLPYKCMCQ